MPKGDRTGPKGVGPMTGRAAGYCAGYGIPGYASPIPGRGFGVRWRCGGGGHGWRRWYYAAGLPGWARFGYAPAWGAPPTREQEAEFLKARAEWLKGQLDAIGQRITELEKEA